MRDFSVGRLEALLRRPRTHLRHDIDVSIDAACEMAMLEARLEVTACYYLMVDSPFYSAVEAVEFAAHLGSLGHKVGWHADPRDWPPDLIAATNPPWRKVSFHCPRESELWVRFPGFESAYDPIWQGHYFADSRGRFAHGDPEDHGPSAIQVNLHPVWWFEPDWHERIDGAVYEAFFHEPKSLINDS